MPRLFSLGTLVTRCQQRADKESDGAVTEWKSLISEKYGEVYGLVSESGLSYFESTSDITATGAASYNSPADEMSIISVAHILDATTGARRELTLLMPQERARWSGLTGDAVGFAFAGDQLELYPRPSSGTYRVHYVPQSPDLSSESDNTSVDVINTDGEAALIWGVAAMASDKSESDLRFRQSMSDAAKERLHSWALQRAIHYPRRRIVEGYVDPTMPYGDGWYT